MSIQIRPATAEDVPSIAAILKVWFARLAAEPDDALKERILRHLQLSCADDSHSVYVAEDTAGVVVGYGAVHWLPYLILAGPEGYVSELFVHPEAQGQGVGTQLLETIKQEGLKRGCARLMLLNIRSRESYQRGFYTKNGWEERPDAANFVYRLHP